MGRTRRKRSKKKPRCFTTCDHNEELINLNSWLAAQGLCRNDKLVLASFNDTGRGVMTKRKIYPGEELLNMPLNLTINVTTVLMDKTFNQIFCENKMDCLQKYKQSLSFQSLLAFYLVYHKVQESQSLWYLYLKSLPKEYTVPYFLPKDVQNCLDAKMQSVISKQSDVIDSSYNIFNNILNNNFSKNDILSKLKESYSRNLYEWAYFTVNTRCVYMDLTKVVDMNNYQHSLLNLINDNTKIALCPYLDMINHSPKARNETKLILNSCSDNINLDNLDKDLFSDIRFSIYTNNTFEPFTQVFICYGDSYNVKLLMEYGFILPNNELDYIPFDFDVVELYLKMKELKLSKDQITFIQNHGLNKDLYVDQKGLSFNFYALLMVVKFYYKQNSDVSRIIYSSMNGVTEDSNFNDLVTPLVKEKIVDIRKSVDQLETFGNNNVILNNCVELMCHYISILENFIKC
ncbi:SET domain-containing protein 4 [Plutella xylostella]|uniref:SET domain-containing protein 4 n=1 Tax=Plutella xylostella TaxID=51655 RepID=UPI002032528F|nr:SET domain-containing protein 4 [Plutella xylostella]